MLLAEQYLAIYLLSIFLVSKFDVRVLCIFLVADFLLDSLLYTYFGYSPKEYLIMITVAESFMLLFSLQFIRCFKLRDIFILCYIPTVLNPLFLLSIDHWITRNDSLSYALFLFCSDVGKYSNEVFLTYIVYTNREKTLKSNFWQMFIAINYITIFLR